MRSRILALLVNIQATTKPKMTGEGGLFFIQDPTSVPPIPRPLICISIALQGLSLVGDMVWYVTESAPISFDLSFLGRLRRLATLRGIKEDLSISDEG